MGIALALGLLLLAVAVTGIAQQLAGPTVLYSRRKSTSALTPVVLGELKVLCASKMSWTWVIVAEQNWEKLIAQTPNLPYHTDTIFSVLNVKRTWLRESAFLGNPPRLRKALAHELAHIRLKTQDEDAANREGERILAKAGAC